MHIHKPTRLNACLDQIASNVKKVEARTHSLYLSDHDTAQTLTFNVKKSHSFITWVESKRDYCNDNMRKFRQCLAAMSFSDVLKANDLQDAFTLFYDLVCLFFNLCFPMIKVKVTNRRKNVNWLTKGIKKSCHVKRKLYIMCRNKSNNNSLSKVRFKKYSQILRKCIHKSQQFRNNQYIQSNKNKCKATWNLINPSYNDHCNSINSLTYNNATYNNPQDICNLFNDFFIDIVNNHVSLNSSLNNLNCRSNHVHSMFLRPIEDNEVLKLIMSLKNSKSCGHDDISTMLLKSNAVYLYRPMAHLINLSFSQGVFPKQLKLSIVKPLFKKGDRKDPNNYRPITLVPVMSKVFEKAMFARIIDYLTLHKIILPEQFGFRKGCSTELACFDFIKDVTEAINAKLPVMSIFLDMSKAFDCVNHTKLLSKLESYGVRGNVLDWMRSYLANREQCTEIYRVAIQGKNLVRENYRSQYRVNQSGVPQGSNLGPLLFLLYINDLPQATSQKCLLFADDTTLIVKETVKNMYESDINKALADVSTWTDHNNLNINIDKTSFIQFHSYKSNPIDLIVNLNNTPISETHVAKFLGLFIDKHLNWKYHIDSVCSKLARFVFALRRLKNSVSTQAALTAYHGYVSSTLNYGLLLWGNSVDIQRAFLIQKKCLRAVGNAKFDDSCRPLFQKFKVLPLASMYILRACVFAETHPNYFKKRDEMFTRELRAQYKNLLYRPTCRSDIYKKNAYNMCIVLFNKLPNDLRILHGKVFKTRLTKWLQDHCFYSVNDFLNCNG
jgi:hypothetical protein